MIDPLEHPQINEWKRVGKYMVMVRRLGDAGYCLRVDVFAVPTKVRIDWPLQDHDNYPGRFVVMDSEFSQAMDELMPMLMLEINPPFGWRQQWEPLLYP